MRQQRSAILRELLDRIAFFRFTATSCSTAIEDDGVITLTEHRHNPNVPGGRRPPRRRHEQDRFALSCRFVVKTDIAYVCRRHLTSVESLKFLGPSGLSARLAGITSSEAKIHRLAPIGCRTKKSCSAASPPVPSQKVICFTFGIKNSSQPGVSSARRLAVPTGVLPRRLTSSSAPQRMSAGTFISAAFARVSQVRRASS